MKQSQRKPVQPHEAQHKRECNHSEQHQQEKESLQKTGQQKRVRLFWHFHPAMLFFRVAGKLTKQQKQIMSFPQKPPTKKHLFSGISQKQKQKQAGETRFKKWSKEETVNNISQQQKK